MESRVLSLLFITVALAYGAVLHRLKVPSSPVLFFTGLALGRFGEGLGYVGQAVEEASRIDPRGILTIFLPALIFESGFNAEWHVFWRQSGQILILAFPSVAVSAFCLMLSIKLLLGLPDEQYTWLGAYMFGAILSCTDTVAVLALLKDIGAPIKFNSLIEGESLLNDGSCMVIFTVCLELLLGRAPSLLGVISLFLQMTVGGLLLGLCFALLTIQLLKWAAGSSLTILNATVCMCYATYVVAEYSDLGLRVSGIMSLVSMGLAVGVFGKRYIPVEAARAVNSFWKYLIFMANTVIFLLAGVLVGTRIAASAEELQLGPPDFGRLFLLYLSMIAARFIGILVFKSLLSRMAYGLTLREILVLTVGGLRGAVGISFALIVAQNQGLPLTLRRMILFHMAGCAVLTILINSQLTGPVVRCLGLCSDSAARKKVFAAFLQSLLGEAESQLARLKEDEFTKEADSSSVEQLLGLDELRETLMRERTRESVSQAASREEEVECRDRFLHALKGILHCMYEEHQCSAEALSVLVESCDWDLDSINEPLNSWEYLQSYFDRSQWLTFLFRVQRLPMLSGLARTAILDLLFLIYDTTETYINALHESSNATAKFHVSRRAIASVQAQSEQNQSLAENFLDRMVNKSFPDIKQVIKLKKEAKRVVLEAAEALLSQLRAGELDLAEFKLVHAPLKACALGLQDYSPSWQAHSKPFAENLRACSCYQLLRPWEAQLQGSVQETVYAPSQFLARKGDKCKHAFLVVRGEVQEHDVDTERPFSRLLGPGSLLGGLDLVTGNNRHNSNVYSSSLVVAYRFPSQLFLRIFEESPQFKVKMWEDNFDQFVSAHLDRLRPLLRAPFVLDSVTLMDREQTCEVEQLAVLVQGSARQADSVFQSLLLLRPGRYQFAPGSILCRLRLRMQVEQQRMSPSMFLKQQMGRQTFRQTHKFLFE